MGKRYLRSIVSDFQTLTASADITPVDLPVNPLSHLILTIQGTQVAETSADEYGYLSDFVDGISEVSIRHRGENIIQGQLADIVMLNAALHKYHPTIIKPDVTTGRIRTASFIIAFGRKPYWPKEAFPATQRGNLRFHMTSAALPASFSARSWTLEAVELIEDTPDHFLKYTTSQRALTATGRQRMPLPIGNDIMGILLFDPTTTAQNPSDFAFQKVKIMRDNVEQYFAESNWESLVESWGRRGLIPHAIGGHAHGTIPTVVDTLTTTTLPTTEERFDRNQLPNRYAYLDFDPLTDGYYALDTRGAATLDIDLNSDVSTGTVRILPVELLAVPGGAAA